MTSDGQPMRGDDLPEFVVGSDALSRAFSVARRAHSGQARGGHGRPYLEHPTQVAELLNDQGYDEDVCVAGLLHDVVEKSGVTVDEVREEFGPRVAVLVEALTEDPAIEDWELRKSALREGAAGSGTEGVAIYIADKLANLHDWRAVYSEVGERAVQFFKAPTLAARLRAWRADLEMGERAAPPLALNHHFREELEQFEAEMSAGS